MSDEQLAMSNECEAQVSVRLLIPACPEMPQNLKSAKFKVILFCSFPTVFLIAHPSLLIAYYSLLVAHGSLLIIQCFFLSFRNSF